MIKKNRSMIGVHVSVKQKLKDLMYDFENWNTLLLDAARLLRIDRNLENKEVQDILKRTKKLRDETK